MNVPKELKDGYLGLHSDSHLNDRYFEPRGNYKDEDLHMLRHMRFINNIACKLKYFIAHRKLTWTPFWFPMREKGRVRYRKLRLPTLDVHHFDFNGLLHMAWNVGLEFECSNQIRCNINILNLLYILL